jgi:N-acetyl-S-(2-succino)cysteine monooxygenase
MIGLKRTMRLGLLLAGSGGYSVDGRHRPVATEVDIGFKHIVRWAKMSQESRQDFIFLGGTTVVSDLKLPLTTGKTELGPINLEPLTLAAALAAETSHIGLITTAFISLNHPFALARRLASIDHLSQGRAGWHLVTTATPDEKLNNGLGGTSNAENCHERAREFIAVVQGLFDGWEPGAFPRNRTTGVYMDPAKMHRLHHTGRHFKVRGPIDVDRPPQGALPIISEASSDEDQDFVAEVADMVFGGQPSVEDARAHYSTIKFRRAHHGRTPESLRVMPTIMLTIGRTQTEAEDLFAALPDEVFRRTGHFGIVGTPTLIADAMEDWFTTGAADGFVVQLPYLFGGSEDFAYSVIPELQRRGLFRTEYEGTTLRENLGMTPFAAWQDPSTRNI